MTKHKCFISFKSKDMHYKEYLQQELKIHMVDRSLNVPINSEIEDVIMRTIREKYLSDSTVTIHLIGKHSAENDFFETQNYIKRELQASLYNRQGNTRSGILGVVLPCMYNSIYGTSRYCSECSSNHNTVLINDNTVVKEFSYNYYIPKNDGCGWLEDDRYCELVKWSDFIEHPGFYIDKAYNKRKHPISSKIKVRP